MPWRACLLLPLLAVLAIPYPLPAQPAFLVKDIYQSGTAPYLFTSHQELTGLGNNLFFVQSDGVHGFEIWKSDGTGPGTALVTDLCPGFCSSLPSSLTVFNGLLFFIADDGVHGRELWKSDGTAAGTILVKDIYPGMGDREPFRLTSPGNLLAADGVLYFTIDDGEHGQELWKSDGTPEGTVLVRDINPGPDGSNPRPWAAAGGILLLNADDGAHGREPWASDGTEAGTILIEDINPGSPSSTRASSGEYGQDAIAAPGGGFLFWADNGSQGEELWRTDGTETGTVLLKDINPGSGGSQPSFFAAVGPVVCFVALEPLNGRELWKTDGTEAGTTLLKDIWAGGVSSNPTAVTASGGRIFFRAVDPSHGHELWTSDGTGDGTRLVKDISPGSGSGLSIWTANLITPFGEGVMVSTAGFGLWRSDGTEAGTVAVLNSPVQLGSELVPKSSAAAGSTFFFTEIHFAYEAPPILWKSNGVSAGRIPVTPPAPWSLRPDLAAVHGRFVEQGGRFLFTAALGNLAPMLWSSDATPDGTILLNLGLSIHLTPLGGLTILAADGQLTRSDGTSAGTQLVSETFSQSYDTDGPFPVLGGSVLFPCYSAFPAGTPPVGLCRSDGTPEGTGVVTFPQIQSGLFELTSSGSNVFFTAVDAAFGKELWKSDGTAAGTLAVRDIRPGGDSSPGRLTDVAGTLFFAAATEVEGRELWKTDGTAAGTVLVKDIRPGEGSSIGTVPRWPDSSWVEDLWGGFTAAVGNLLFFVANDGSSGSELWKSDGTAAGTVLVKDIAPGPSGSEPLWLTRVGSRIYFAANDGVHGRELWVSDGTEAGTRMVTDILPGSGSSMPQQLQALGHILLFSATDGVHGLEAWRTGGSALGTRMIQDIAPGALPSSPSLFTSAGSHVFFAANDGAIGFEPWAVPWSNVLSTFGDLSTGFWAWPFIEALAAAGLTTGCAPGLFCPETFVSRAEAAVFLIRGTHGAGFTPPAATGAVFSDVPASYWGASWIEQMFQDGLTTGCAASPPRFCPEQPLTRAEMAVFLLRAKHGGAYTPPPATGTVFTDVPANYWAASWIEQLAAEGITTGCAPGLYCPDASVSRAQTAAFLTRTFSLPLPAGP